MPDDNSQAAPPAPHPLSVQAEKAERNATRYEVSQVTDDTQANHGVNLRILGVIDATSGSAAIRAWHASDPNLVGGVTLRAVPVRNISELTAKVEQVERVVFA